VLRFVCTIILFDYLKDSMTVTTEGADLLLYSVTLRLWQSCCQTLTSFTDLFTFTCLLYHHHPHIIHRCICICLSHHYFTYARNCWCSVIWDFRH